MTFQTYHPNIMLYSHLTRPITQKIEISGSSQSEIGK